MRAWPAGGPVAVRRARDPAGSRMRDRLICTRVAATRVGSLSRKAVLFAIASHADPSTGENSHPLIETICAESEADRSDRLPGPSEAQCRRPSVVDRGPRQGHRLPRPPRGGAVAPCDRTVAPCDNDSRTLRRICRTTRQNRRTLRLSKGSRSQEDPKKIPRRRTSRARDPEEER